MKKQNAFLTLFLVILQNILGFFLVYVNGGKNNTVLYIGLAVVSLIFVSTLIVTLLNLGDTYIFQISAMLVSIGIIMLTRINIEYGIRQAVWLFLGVLAFFVTYFIYPYLKDKFVLIYLGLSFVLFILTLLFGKTVNGSRNWIVIFGHSFQPAEVIKMLYILTLSSLFCHAYKEGQRGILKIYNDKRLRPYLIMCVAYAHMFFLILQRDWGLCVLFFVIYFFMLYCFSQNILIKALNVALFSFGGFLGYHFMSHIRRRVSIWINPYEDITGAGYQITQSLFAIGEGGFTGSGIGLGSPYYIPEVHSDFIFSAICEELGILGGVGVILLFFIFVYRLFKIAIAVRGGYHKMTAFGIAVMFSFQIFIIIGGVIKLIPLTGITLPFISYGGSSLVTTFMSLGFMMAISKEAYNEI
ncbi:MAG: FtsW/RodA/SpoVE family cell cycle protein [Clostridiaceae bacterium]|nr:FtsW/RodA/SpoVE family cell cycle protein [Clostridiaceae bacterium]